MTFSDWVDKWIAQLAHVGWGGALTLAIGLHTRARYAAIVVILLASAKEGIFDPITETKAEQGSGWEDWAFWVVGIIFGALNLWLR
jgi:hypothetical protein